MRYFRLCALMLTTLAAARSADATQWQSAGPRAMAMGGSGVALAQGPLGEYWNPGGLGQLYNTTGFDLSVGGRGDFTGNVLQGANDFNQLVADCQAGNLARCTQANINSAIANLGQPGNGALGGLLGAMSAKIGQLAVFFNESMDIGATPQSDTVNVSPNPLSPQFINNNQSSLILRGGAFSEIGVGYGLELGKTGLSVGGNLKGIIGKIGYDVINLRTDRPGSGSFTKFDKNSKSSFQPGIDVGALWDMRESFPVLPMRPRLGIVARNINNPKFDQPDAAKQAGERGHYSLQGQTRVGAVISPLHFWNIAADADLGQNLTPVAGYKSQFLGLGTEVNVLNRTWINIPLRAGVQKNVAAGSQNSGVSYTAGFGLNFLHAVFDLGGMISSKNTTLQSQGKSQKIPNNFGVSAQFAVLFGGEDEGTGTRN